MSRASTFHASTNGGGAQNNVAAGDGNASSTKTYFEVQREGLMRDIGVVSFFVNMPISEEERVKQ